jgi:hypothetical protein
VRVKRIKQPDALRARDDGLRRVRKITWRAGLLATAGAVVVGARFAHLSPSLPHLSSDLTGGQTSSSGQQATTSSGQQATTSSGSASSTGVSPAAGGGQVTSGGS